MSHFFKKHFRHFFYAFALTAFLPLSLAYAETYSDCANPTDIPAILKQAPELKPEIFNLALNAYQNICHKMGADKQGILSIIDYTKPSNEERFWIIDLRQNAAGSTHVAHGKDSGLLYPTHFSNESGSLASSIGAYVTDGVYIGKHGISLRINGLDVGFNDNAFRRLVVIHKAWYISPAFLTEHKYIGRSWGCPAISNFAYGQALDLLKNGTVLLIYYPDQKWLETSPWIKPFNP